LLVFQAAPQEQIRTLIHRWIGIKSVLYWPCVSLLQGNLMSHHIFSCVFLPFRLMTGS